MLHLLKLMEPRISGPVFQVEHRAGSFLLLRLGTWVCPRTPGREVLPSTLPGIQPAVDFGILTNSVLTQAQRDQLDIGHNASHFGVEGGTRRLIMTQP